MTCLGSLSNNKEQWSSSILLYAAYKEQSSEWQILLLSNADHVLKLQGFFITKC